MLQSHSRIFHHTIFAVDLLVIGASVLLTNTVAQLSGYSLLGSVGGGSLTGGASVATGLDGYGLLGQLACLFFAWFVISSRRELYQSRRTESYLREIGILAETWLLTLAVGLLLSLSIWGGIAFMPPAALLLGLLLFIGQRFALRELLRSLRIRGHNFRRVLFVGNGKRTRSLAKSLRANPHYGIHIAGWLGFDGQGDPCEEAGERLGAAADLRSVLTEEQIAYVVLCPPNISLNVEIREVLHTCDEAGIQCHLVPSITTMTNLHPSVSWYAGFPTVTFHAQPYLPLKSAIKRAMDISVACLAITIFMPLMLLIALAIKLQDGGPILYLQRRVGRGNQIFACCKFRTMCVEAESQLAGLQAQNEQDGPVFKIAKDPRITRVGRLLRRFSLDELPQFFNVLMGQMSMVGPRPPIPDEVMRYEWWQRRRISVRPGLTCIWQVWGRNKVSFQRWMEMDMYYIDHWTLWMDTKIMLRTVWTMMRGTGA